MAAPSKVVMLGKSAAKFSSIFSNSYKFRQVRCISQSLRTSLQRKECRNSLHYYVRGLFHCIPALDQSVSHQSCLLPTASSHNIKEALIDVRQNRHFLVGHSMQSELLCPAVCLITGRLLSRGYRSRRGLDVDEFEEDASGDGRRRTYQAEKDDYALMLRTTVENGYLSWTRNTYILTVAGVTMYNQVAVPFAQEAAVVLLLVGGINLGTGTSMYVYNIITRRRRMLMSGMSSLILSGISILHVMLWMGALMVYVGYVEEDPTGLEEELRKEEDRFQERKKKLAQVKRISDRYD